MENFKNATARYLDPKERKVSTTLSQIPLVIEPAEKNQKAAPADFMAENSMAILTELTKHGAVLLRGLNINSDKDFEETVIAIKGLQGMPNYFMAEPGRTVVEGLKYVHYTNKNYKTGGSYRLGGIHTENYYTTDVPGFITFCCIKPSLFGGETGLVHMGNIYKNLNPALKKKLEAKTFLSQMFDVKNVAKKYSISEEQVKEICANNGVPVNVTTDGKEMVSLYKPSILFHPLTSEPTLSGNISREVKGLDASLKKLMLADYSGFKWLLHRIYWRYPNIVNPKALKKEGLKGKSEASEPQPAAKTEQGFSTERMGSAFTREDIEQLAKLTRENLTSFTWKKGDILLVDNFQMAHTGLPGFGARTIRALLCNPVMINSTEDGPGSLDLHKDLKNKSLVATIEKIKKEQGSLV